VLFVAEPKPHLRMVFSNSQLTNSSMLKTPTPLSKEQREIESLKEIQNFLVENKIKNAIHKLHLFVGNFPGNLQARILLVSLLIENGRIRKADEILMIGLNRHHDYIPFVKLKARILLKKNNPKAASLLLEKHMATTNDVELLGILAALYQEQGRFMPAAEIYNQLTKIQPQKTEWWVGLGVALEDANKINASKEAYRRAYNTPNISVELDAFLREKFRK